MSGEAAAKMCSKFSVQKAPEMFKLVTWSFCIIREKVGIGLVAGEPCVKRTPVLVLLAMNMVLIHLKTGIAAMDQSSRFMLMRNSWETQSTTKMTSCCSTSDT